MSDELPSPEIISQCCEVVAEQLLIGALSPLDVSLPMPAVDSSFLNGLEQAIFTDAAARDAEHLRCEWGAFRIVRALADDDVAAVRSLLACVLVGPLNARLRQMMDALRGHSPIVPAHGTRSVH